jgi:hypothetical protein
MSRQIETVNAFILDIIDHSMAREIDENILPLVRASRRRMAKGMKDFLGGVAAKLEYKKAVKIRVRDLSDGSRYFTIGRGRRICYFVPSGSIEHNYPQRPDRPGGTAV